MIAPLKQLERLFGESVLPLFSYAQFNESCRRFRSSAPSKFSDNQPDYPSNHTVEGLLRRCGYGDGAVHQHRLRQFPDDERRTLSEHHPQVLELLPSSARKWRIPYPLRNTLPPPR